MKIAFECYPCMLNSVINMNRIFNIDTETTSRLLSRVMRHLSEINLAQSAPSISKYIQNIVREELGNADPYSELKREYNKLMLNLYPELEQQVFNSSTPYLTALKLAIAGNIIDFGANQEIDIHRTIDKVLETDFAIDESLQLKEEFIEAKTVLYLGDNCGEIVADKLFIQTLFRELGKPEEFYFSVRGNPILNDVTREDAEFVGMDKLAKIIDTNDDAPGVLLENASDSYKEIYNRADLIISKGMGNFESLSERKENIYFLLIAKCKLVAGHLGVKKGDTVVAKTLSRIEKAIR